MKILALIGTMLGNLIATTKISMIQWKNSSRNKNKFLPQFLDFRDQTYYDPDAVFTDDNNFVRNIFFFCKIANCTVKFRYKSFENKPKG